VSNQEIAGRRHGSSDLWARLKPGVTREQALAQLNTIERRWHVENSPQGLVRFDALAQPFQFDEPNPLTARLLLLQSGALFVLLVGGMNVVNLLLGRASRRCHELCVRHSLGAGRSALVRLMLSESVLLAVVGAASGTALAWGGLQVINRYLAVLLPSTMPVTLSNTTFLWILATASALALVMGLLPMAFLWNSGRIQQLDNSANSASSSGRTRAFSGSLIVAQVAVTTALLIGSGLLLRSYANVLAVDSGFDASKVVTGYVHLHETRWNAGGYEYEGVAQRIVEAMKEIPGIERVSYTGNGYSVGEDIPIRPMHIRGTDYENPEQGAQVIYRHATSDYFQTMGIPILEGRAFRHGDETPYSAGMDLDERRARRTSYIVDEAFAKRYLKGGSALDVAMRVDDQPTWSPIVGVAGRANFQGLDKRDGLPVVYFYGSGHFDTRVGLVLRTTRPAEAVIGEMRQKLHEINPGLYVHDATSMADAFDTLLAGRQVITFVIGVYAGLALLLSTIGIYGVLAYDVQQRQREIGIRSALGATRRQIVDMVLRHGLRKTILGLAVGLIGAVALSRYLNSLLFDVSALDPATYAMVSLGLLFVALAASFVPARRATKVDAVIALRAE